MTTEKCDVSKLSKGFRISKWTIETKLADGDFGYIYVGKDTENKDSTARIAIKCVGSDGISSDVLKWEAAILVTLKSDSRHFCDIIHAGHCTKKDSYSIDYIVMTLIGKSLVDVVKASKNGVLTPSCAMSVGKYIIEACEDLHVAGHIHRDVKPANICIGRKEKGELAKIYLVGFSISKKFFDKNGKIRAPRKIVHFRGTERYASMNCHHRKDLGRNDDLESAFYVMSELMIGKLPWKGVNKESAVFHAKQQLRTPEKFAEYLEKSRSITQLSGILNIIDSCTYHSTPDYSKIYHLLDKAITNFPDQPFDWCGSPPLIILTNV